MTVIKSNQIRQSARGEGCTINIYSVCNYDPETTVYAHVKSPMSGYKSSDLAGGIYCCSSCHDALDRRVINESFESERDAYTLRAVQKTLHKLFEKGIVTVKGVE